ncbi:transposase [Endozoicomonas sp. G2_2]|uniref:transposase n=1 Tax=Endozoicomonas sp. G2_2 TaxID=2821092 RepID=UPI001ADB6DA1|nr:transposase [Endozoicomonas sp. G2_2]MBO9468907.1 transposase [Endozoicomonas sp. G2_2]
MPRLPRFNLVDVPQHVIQRGNNRQACFFEADDYLFYLECLKEASKSAGCDIHAYVLMTNHVHILATPRRDHAVSRMMQSVGRRYVQYVNRKNQRTGTLWRKGVRHNFLLGSKLKTNNPITMPRLPRFNLVDATIKGVRHVFC